MTIYEDLCQLHAGWAALHDEYWITIYEAAWSLSRQFGAYIGAQPTFSDPETHVAIPYIKILRHKIVGDRNIPEDVDALMGAFDYDPDGYIRFCLSIAFEKAPRSYPKPRIGLFLRLKIIEGEMHFQLLNKQYRDFVIDPTQPKNFEALFAAMVDLLKYSFGSKPWEPTQSSQIGFDISPPSAPSMGE